MAKKTRVSLIRRAMAAAAIRGLTCPAAQYLVGGICTALAPQKNIKLPARTASHELVKKAIIHGSLLNIARSRKKKSRDVDVIVAEKKTSKNLPSTLHV